MSCMYICVFDIWESKLFLDLLVVVAPRFECLAQHNFPVSIFGIAAVKTTRCLLAMDLDLFVHDVSCQMLHTYKHKLFCVVCLLKSQSTIEMEIV